MASAGLARFTLLASAVAGRLVAVAPGNGGEPAWTDGVTIFIDCEATEREQLRTVVVQAALLGAGSLRADVVRSLTRRPTLARRYLAVEGHRALAAHEALLPAAVRPLLDARVAERTASPATSLSLARTRQAIDDPPASFGTLRPRRMRTPDDAIERTASAPEVRRREELARSELDRTDDDTHPDISRFASPVGGGGTIGRLLKRMVQDARSSDAGPPGHDSRRSTRRSAEPGRGTMLTIAHPTRAERAAAPARRGTTYPEWDASRRRYRRDWCTVFEVDVEREAPSPSVPPDTHALRRPLAGIGLELERRGRQLQGDDIDIDATVEAYVESAAGVVPDEAVYVDSVRRRRDLAVLVLLDVSGSAGEPSTSGASVHEHQRAAAAVLVATLHGLGDRVALYAFSSRGRRAVNVVRVKQFADDFDARVLHRLGALVPGAYTRLGAVMRHGASVLETRGGAPRRLLVVLSDGFAYDHGYEGAYGEADARRALTEARRRGVGCACVTVGAGTDADTLHRVFGTAAHATVPRVEDLARVVGPLFHAALRSAEHERYMWQRATRTRERLEIERSMNSMST